MSIVDSLVGQTDEQLMQPVPEGDSEAIQVLYDMDAIDKLDTGRRGGPETTAVTLEAFGRDIPEE